MNTAINFLSASYSFFVPASKSFNEKYEFIDNLKESSESIKSQLGYFSLPEGILLANVKLLLSDNPRYMEYNECIKTIEDFQTENPKHVKIGIDRMGNKVSLRFLK